MSRSHHSPKRRLCQRHTCLYCWPDGSYQLARAPTVDEYEPDVPTCTSCGSETDGYCECGDSDGPDEEMAACGFELVRTQQRYGGTVTVTREHWHIPDDFGAE